MCILRGKGPNKEYAKVGPRGSGGPRDLKLYFGFPFVAQEWLMLLTTEIVIYLLHQFKFF